MLCFLCALYGFVRFKWTIVCIICTHFCIFVFSCIYIYIHFWWGGQGGIHGTTNQKNQGCYSAKTKIGAKKYYTNRCKAEQINYKIAPHAPMILRNRYTFVYIFRLNMAAPIFFKGSNPLYFPVFSKIGAE